MSADGILGSYLLWSKTFDPTLSLLPWIFFNHIDPTFMISESHLAILPTMSSFNLYRTSSFIFLADRQSPCSYVWLRGYRSTPKTSGGDAGHDFCNNELEQ